MDSYEAQHFAPDPKTRAVAEATLELLVSFYPRILARPVEVFSRALMDDALLAAFGFEKPSPLVVALARGGLRLRGRHRAVHAAAAQAQVCQGPQAHQDLSRRVHGRAARHVPRHDAREARVRRLNQGEASARVARWH